MLVLNFDKLTKYINTLSKCGVPGCEMHIAFEGKPVYSYVAGFSDKDVHAVLSNSGKRQIKPNGTSGNEWFEVDLATAKNAISPIPSGRTRSAKPNKQTGTPKRCACFHCYGK